MEYKEVPQSIKMGKERECNSAYIVFMSFSTWILKPLCKQLKISQTKEMPMSRGPREEAEAGPNY